MATQVTEKINEALQSRKKSARVQNPENGKSTDNLQGLDI